MITAMKKALLNFALSAALCCGTASAMVVKYTLADGSNHVITSSELSAVDFNHWHQWNDVEPYAKRWSKDGSLCHQVPTHDGIRG